VVEETDDRDGCNKEHDQGVLEGRHNSWKIVLNMLENCTM